MKFIYSIVFFALLLPLNGLFGQWDISSSLDTYNSTNDIDEKAELADRFYEKLNDIDHDSLMYYVRDLQTRGLEEGREDVVALSNKMIASYLQHYSLYKEAEERLRSALSFYHMAERDTSLVEVYNSMGNIRYLMGDFRGAKEFYNQALSHSMRVSDRRYFMLAFYSMANLEIETGNQAEGREKILEYIKFQKFEDSDTSSMLGSAYGLLGKSYLKDGDYEKAAEAFNENVEVGLNSGNNKSVANAYTNMGITSYLSKEYANSEIYFRKALDFRHKERDKFYISEGYYNMGDYFLGLNKLDSSLTNFKKAFSVAEEAKSSQLQKDALMMMDSIYALQNLPAKQIEVLKQIIDLQIVLDKQLLDNEKNALIFNHSQIFAESKNTSAQREDTLEGRVDGIESVFNSWMVIVIVEIALLTVLFAFLRKRKKKKEEESVHI